MKFLNHPIHCAFYKLRKLNLRTFAQSRRRFLHFDQFLHTIIHSLDRLQNKINSK